MSRKPSSHVGIRPLMAARTGLTLLEVLLSLAVIAIFVTLAWPSVLRMYGEQQILSAAEKVRAFVATARVHAIESGLSYQFRHESEGSHFLVVPFEREFESVELTSKGGGTAEGLGRFSRASGTLPKNVTFSARAQTGSASTPLASQQLSSDALSGLPDANKLSGLSWSGPIVFQPNGSAADAEFMVVDRRNQRIVLRVRGITGAVSMSRIQREDRR